MEDIFLPKKPISSVTTNSNTIISSKDDNGNSNNVVSDLPSTNMDKKPMNKALKTSLIVGAFLIPIIVGVIYFKRKTK